MHWEQLWLQNCERAAGPFKHRHDAESVRASESRAKEEVPGQGVQVHEVRGSPSSIWQDHAGGRATRSTEAGRKERKTPNVNTTTTQVFQIEKDGFDVIFNNVTLVDLATRQPMTCEELLTISWIGEKKVELYGDEIVMIIQRYNQLIDTTNIK